MASWPTNRASLGNRWGVNPFELLGFEDQSLLTQMIDLSVTEEELWSGLAQSARQAVRKAQQAGYRAAKVDWPTHLGAYYAMHCETYRRTGVDPHPRAYFEGIAAFSAATGANVLFAAFGPDGQALAFHNDARLAPGATYHIGCSLDAAKGIGLDYLLMWEAMRDAKATGFGWYDCGWIFPAGAVGKQHGLTLFKTRFGGEAHRAFRARLRLRPAGDATRTRRATRAPQPAPPEPAPLLRRLTRRLGLG